MKKDARVYLAQILERIDRIKDYTTDGKQVFFNDSLACMSATGETTPDLWRRFEATRRWRRKQMDAGLVEVTVTGTEPDADSAPPADGMHIDDVNDRFSEFGVLTGWGEKSENQHPIHQRRCRLRENLPAHAGAGEGLDRRTGRPGRRRRHDLHQQGRQRSAGEGQAAVDRIRQNP
jgi:hypothetical protein